MKENWMKNLTFDWLVQGHLTRAQAWELVDRTCEKITNYKEIVKPIVVRKYLNLAPRSLLNTEKTNVDENVNNGFIAVWQCCPESDYIEHYCLLMIVSMHKQELFAQLRTKEQLCYL